jgi:serine/threonine protein kinase
MIYLEENNIIHRDLKLDNIFVKKDGELLILKIADFGQAKIFFQNYSLF